MSEKILDLGGLSVEEKTVVFDQAAIQEPTYTSLMSGANPGDFCFIHDLVSSTPLDFGADPGIVLNDGAGFPQGVGDFEHIIYGRFQRLAADLDYGSQFPLLVDTKTFGSMEPTASDRLYVYRLVYFDVKAPIQQFNYGAIGPARVMFSVNSKEEAQYRYLMRLMRSYELQQEPDRD